MFDHNLYEYYTILNRDIKGSKSFSSYTDIQGNTFKAINGYDTKGVPRPFMITFGPGELTYRAGKKQEVTVLVNGDPKKMKLTQYMDNASMCEGSPNNNGVSDFKRIDMEKDAQILVSAKRLKKQASDAAFALEPNTKDLQEVSQLIGEFRDNKDIQLQAVIQSAEHNPKEFLEIVNSPDRQARALIRKGLNTGEITMKGKMVTWKGANLGPDEDDAVQSLLKDKDLLKAVEQAVKKLK